MTRVTSELAWRLLGVRREDERDATYGGDLFTQESGIGAARPVSHRWGYLDVN